MKNKKQFTLIELIIVIVVIGILAAMAMPKFNGVVREAKLTAMIRDKETLEKTLIIYYQKNDELPLLNEDEELIIANEGISLTKIVLAEEATSSDMATIYTSLQETLNNYNDSEDNIYRIDLSKIKDNLSKDIKYGHKKHDKDFYVYSMKTGNVYYYDYLVNSHGTVQHTEYDTLLKDNELVEKKFSYNLGNDGNVINNNPIVELTTNLEGLKSDSIINWTYTFTDEDKVPTKISFILNEVEYDSFDKIPTKLEGGDYTIKLKMQDSKGLWSNEVLKEFSISKDILEDRIYMEYGNGYGGYFGISGYFDKNGEYVITDSKKFNSATNSKNIYFKYEFSTDYEKLDDLYLEVSTSIPTNYTGLLQSGGRVYPKEKTYKIPLSNISENLPENIPSGYRAFNIASIYPKENNSSLSWTFTSMRIVKE